MNIKGILTNCYTNKESTVNLEYEINENDRHELIFKLLNGVTGYESFYIDDYAKENMPMFGWLACAGTPDRWDRLFIPAEEMKKAFDNLKKIIFSKKGIVYDYQEGLLIKKDEICKITVTNYETKEEEILQIKNGEIINNSNDFKLSGQKINDNNYLLDGIIDNSNKFLGKTKNIIITSECK